MPQKNSNCGAGKSWVKDPRVKKGGYCRGLPRGSSLGQPKPSVSGNAFLKGAAILLGGAVVGGAIGVFASKWATKAGVEKQIGDAIAKADEKSEKQVAKVRQELQGEMSERLAQAASESKSSADRKTEAARSEAQKAVEGAISKTRAEMQAEMDLKLASTAEETRSQVETEYGAKTERAVEAARSEAVQSASRAVEQHRREADMDLAVRRQALQAEMSERLNQRETEITKQVHGAAIAQIASERAKSLRRLETCQKATIQIHAFADGQLLSRFRANTAFAARLRSS